MTTEHTLLSYVTAQQYMPSRENAVTDGLRFILVRSAAARREFSDVISNEPASLSISCAKTRTAGSDRSIPDMECLDEAGDVVAILESKIWSGLTSHQPVTYWERLPTDRPSVLAFACPAYSVNRGWYWGDLLARLQNNGHVMEVIQETTDFKRADAADDHRCLVLISWEKLLGLMAQRMGNHKELWTSFAIQEVRGLVDRCIANDNPMRDANVKDQIKKAVNHLVRSRWANTDGLGTGTGSNYFGRYMQFAGVPAGIVIAESAKDEGLVKTLWLTFHSDGGRLTRDEVRRRLEIEKEPDQTGFSFYDLDVSVPIELPDGADDAITLEAIVTRLEQIGKLIDPEGPTYALQDEPK